MAHTFCILALLCLATCGAEKTETEKGFKALRLQQDSWLDRIHNKLESTTRRHLEGFLYKLSIAENGSILHRPPVTEEQQKNRRGLGTGVTIQTRRAGCRVFFWKSWTAC